MVHTLLHCGPQIDAYRFDIMGHLFLQTMRKIQAGLRELTLERDGVDGSGIYIYGETWDFGEACPLCSCTDALHIKHVACVHTTAIGRSYVLCLLVSSSGLPHWFMPMPPPAMATTDIAWVGLSSATHQM